MACCAIQNAKRVTMVLVPFVGKNANLDTLMMVHFVGYLWLYTAGTLRKLYISNFSEIENIFPVSIHVYSNRSTRGNFGEREIISGKTIPA
jgi:hypothetical protein